MENIPPKNKRCRSPARHVAETEAEFEAASQPQPQKRREGDGVGGGDDDEKEEGERSAVTEEEVEEFYAILRSVREARRLGGKLARRAEDQEMIIWQPQFALEDFQYPAAGYSADDDDGKNKAAAAPAAAASASAGSSAAKTEVKIGKVFDLNAQPAAGLGDD